MKSSLINRSIAVLGLAACLGGCGTREESALKAIRKAGFEFSIPDYLRAAAEGKRSVVRDFLQAGMAVNAQDANRDTALIAAAKAGQLKMVMDLMGRRAKLNHAGQYGRTAMLRACEAGHREVAEYLLIFGAELTTPDDMGWTPLTIAAYEGQASVVRLLIPDALPQLDQALLAAAIGGNDETIGVLAQAGAGLEQRNITGLTPLMLAAEAGNLEAVKSLLDHGADKNAVDRKGRTAGEIAAQNGFSSVSEWIGQMPTAVRETKPPQPEAGGDSPYLGAYQDSTAVSPPRTLIPAAGLGAKLVQRRASLLDAPSVLAREP